MEEIEKAERLKIENIRKYNEMPNVELVERIKEIEKKNLPMEKVRVITRYFADLKDKLDEEKEEKDRIEIHDGIYGIIYDKTSNTIGIYFGSTFSDLDEETISEMKSILEKLNIELSNDGEYAYYTFPDVSNENYTANLNPAFRANKLRCDLDIIYLEKAQEVAGYVTDIAIKCINCINKAIKKWEGMEDCESFPEDGVKIRRALRGDGGVDIEFKFYENSEIYDDFVCDIIYYTNMELAEKVNRILSSKGIKITCYEDSDHLLMTYKVPEENLKYVDDVLKRTYNLRSK